MNGFLVVGRDVCFDVPLGFFEQKLDAEAAARRTSPADITDAIREVWSVRAPEGRNPLNVGIVEFRNGRRCSRAR